MTDKDYELEILIERLESDMSKFSGDSRLPL